MKKVVLLLMVIMITVLASCGYGNDDYKTPDESAAEMITDIVVCFENDDKETLKTYFSESAKKNGKLDTEIDEAFEFIDGKIVSYGEPIPGCIGPIEDKAYGATISDIITDKGTEYKISFSGMERMDSDPQQEGVTYIKVINMTLADPLPNDQKEQYIIYIGEHD
ncbi:MAG: DUF5104 domain-containing protein [Ruminococcus sp.]|nr:DUF5104 domain-containing protein [Ruminococcus sp.]